jgi:hypothetical protein
VEQVSFPKEPEVVLRTLQQSLTEDGSIPTQKSDKLTEKT